MKLWTQLLTKRVYLVMLVLILIPAAVMCVFFHQKSVSIAREEFISNMQLTIGQLNTHISNRLLNICELQHLMATDESVIRYLSEDFEKETLYQQFERFKEMTSLLSRMYMNQDVYKAILYVDDNKIYANQQDDFYPISELKANEKLYQTIIEHPTQIVWGAPYTSTRTHVQVIPCYRGIVNITNFEQLAGISVIEIPVSMLEDAIKTSNISPRNSMSFVNADGMVLASSASETASSYPAPNEISVTNAPSSGSIFPDQLLLSQSLAGAPWYVMVEFNEGDIIQTSRIFNFFVSLLTFLLLVVAVVAVTMMVQSYSRVHILNQIQIISQAIDSSLYDTRPQNDNTQQSLDKLSIQVNALITTIQSQLAQIYENELKLKDEQLYALQAQINPHFLYNTLDTINWMAIRIDAKNISYMLEKLALYFRLSLNSGRDIVPLKDELKLVQSYVDIQRVRFENRFQLDCQVDEGLLDWQLPKLTLQPFIENCIIHGFKDQNQTQCLVKITVKEEQGCIIITVADNGCGIDPACANELNLLFDQSATTSSDKTSMYGKDHYGVSNVYQRLKNFMCNQVHMQIALGAGGVGTVVRVELVIAATS